jgi:hypothetical protein
MFSQFFLQSLVFIALAWTACGALALVALLVRDWLNGKLW